MNLVALRWTFSSDSMSFNRYGLHSGEQYSSFDLTRVIYKAFLARGQLESLKTLRNKPRDL